MVNHLSDRLEGLSSEIAGELRARARELTDAWFEQMAQTPQLVSWRRPDVRAVVFPAALVDIERELTALQGGRRLPDACPDEVTQSARLAAANGLPLWASLQAYRVGHAQQWRAWSQAVERRGLDDEDRLALLAVGSDFFFAYADRCTRWLEIEYTAARETPLRRAEQRRVQLVSRVLEGRDLDLSELGYDLSAWHLGLVLDGDDVEQQIDGVAQSVGAVILTVAVEASTLWVWVGSSGSPSGLRDTLGSLRLAPAAHLAIGEVAHGPSGFRESHRQAQVAAAIGGRQKRSVTAYADIALEDLVGRDAVAAEQFVFRELGSLAQGDREARVLRETLTAYFTAAQRASSAAIGLGVHERTVGNRLRRVEDLIGRTVQDRSLELQLALRLYDYIGA